MSKHDFDYYKDAKNSLNEYPPIIKLLEKYEKELYPYKESVGISTLLTLILDIRFELETRVFVAERILKKKGRIDES